MKSLIGMDLEDSTFILNTAQNADSQYVSTSTYVLSESRTNFKSLRIGLGFSNDGFTIYEIPVTENSYFCVSFPTGAGADLYKIFLFVEWTSDYSFTVRTGKDLWLKYGSTALFNNNVILSYLNNAPDTYKCRPFGFVQGLCRKEKDVIPLDLNTWTIYNTNTITIKGGRLIQLGVGGWHENAYKAFTVPETGRYTVSYDYNIVNARCGNHGTCGYGLWFTQNSPAVDGDSQKSFYANSANRTGTVILSQGETGSNKKGHVSYTINCTAGTTYYLWHPGASLDDGTTYNLDLINIRLTKAEDPTQNLLYLSYMQSISGSSDVPEINLTGSSAWDFNSRRSGTGTVTISGAMPSSYSSKGYAQFGGAGTTGILPVTSLRKFTISAWMRSSTSGAGEFWGLRYHTAFNYLWLYFNDASSYLNFNFGLTSSNYTLYEGTNLANTGCNCPTSIATKSGWAYVSLYIDRDNNRAEYWVNGHHILDISGKENLFNGTQDFDTILRFYPDSNYSGFYLCELAVWNGKYTSVPTDPLA